MGRMVAILFFSHIGTVWMNDDAKNHYTSICHPNSMNSENAAMNGKSMSHEYVMTFLIRMNV